MSSHNAPTSQTDRPVSIHTLNEKKANGQPISMLTAYDYSFASRIDATGIDCILVGDSLGNVVMGHDTTLPVSITDMLHHTQAVRRGVKHAFLIADMPFMSYRNADIAADNAHILVGQGGASMVKLEGGQEVLPIITHLYQLGIPVCGHLGLTPQHVHRLGGFKVQGREETAAQQIVKDAQAIQAAGAQMLVLECVPAALAATISQTLDIPVIGIGAGLDTDGQVLVLYDVVGLTVGKAPKFSHNFMSSEDSIQDALQAFVDAVHKRQFPTASHAFN